MAASSDAEDPAAAARPRRESIGEDAVIVALGCNDKGAWSSCHEALEAALARFRPEGLDVTARSSWWASRAWPDPSDPPFLNGIAIVQTELDASDVMAVLRRIEDVFGRRRSIRNAPRTLDLDLVAYGRMSGDFDGLILPHPRAAERLFVMGPLAEIQPDWKHPDLGRSAATLAAAATVGRDASPLNNPARHVVVDVTSSPEAT